MAVLLIQAVELEFFIGVLQGREGCPVTYPTTLLDTLHVLDRVGCLELFVLKVRELVRFLTEQVFDLLLYSLRIEFVGLDDVGQFPFDVEPVELFDDQWVELRNGNLILSNVGHTMLSI